MQTAASESTGAEEEECLGRVLAAPLTDDQNKRNNETAGANTELTPR